MRPSLPAATAGATAARMPPGATRRLACALAVLAAGVALGSALSAPAAAHAGGPSAAVPGREALAATADAVRRLPGGLYEVRLTTGTPLVTHGADRSTAAQPLVPAGGRPPRCAETLHQQVLLGRPAGAADRVAAHRPAIEEAVWRANAELDRAAVESGDRHADYRVACDGSGRLRINSFVNHATGAFADVVDAARLSGATDPNVDYTIFYDAPVDGACGIASFRMDERPGPENANNRGGGYAVLYSGCWNAAMLMHENGHNQGAVQPEAPNGTGDGGHCRDEADVMCYADGGSRDTGVFTRCHGGQRFDCGYDDYFDAAPEPGEYLASRWNVGSPANRFIDFTPLAPHEDPAYSEAACDARRGGARQREGSADLFAADTTRCPNTQHGRPLRSVVITRRPVRVASGRAEVALACPVRRSSPCRGIVSVSAPGERRGGRRRFRLTPGSADVTQVRLSPSARRAAASAALRRVLVVASGSRSSPTRRTLRVAAHRRPAQSSKSA